MQQKINKNWYSLPAVLVTLYISLIIKFVYSHSHDLLEAHQIVWTETGKIRRKCGDWKCCIIFSKAFRFFKGIKVIRDIVLLCILTLAGIITESLACYDYLNGRAVGYDEFQPIKNVLILLLFLSRVF